MEDYLTMSASPRFPIVNRAGFSNLPKFRKRGDVKRMLFSPQSEDWLTWSLLNILLMQEKGSWWPHLVAAALRNNPNLDLTSSERETPSLTFWRTVSAPAAYEAASRVRMSYCGDAAWEARSCDPRPVEGKSEIDVIVQGASFVVYIEAKLGSDISMRTTYDPTRNQIARNIDCLFEHAGNRTPLFWMLVRDEDPRRAYTHLMRQYRQQPSLLARDLPHRDPQAVKRIADRLALIYWKDLAAIVTADTPGDSLEIRQVRQEIRRRATHLPLADLSIGKGVLIS